MEVKLVAEIDELLDGLDDAQAEAIREALEKANVLAKDNAKLQRDLKVRQDIGLRDKFPRAYLALEKSRFELGDAVEDKDVLAAFQAKEQELEDLGVPIPGAAAPQVPPTPDPAASFGPAMGAAPAPQARDYVTEFMTAIRGTTNEDRERAAVILNEMNKIAERDPKMREDIEELNARVSGKPIIPLW